MDFKVLTAQFSVYANNFRVMHWNAKGKQFDRIHKTAQKYYEMISDDLDVLAEMAMRVNQEPAMMINILKTLIDYKDKQFFIFEKFEDTDYETFCKVSTTMLQDIVTSLVELLDSDIFTADTPDAKINVGIKAELEGLVSKYDLEARYLCARRFAD